MVEAMQREVACEHIPDEIDSSRFNANELQSARDDHRYEGNEKGFKQVVTDFRSDGYDRERCGDRQRFRH